MTKHEPDPSDIRKGMLEDGTSVETELAKLCHPGKLAAAMHRKQVLRDLIGDDEMGKTEKIDEEH
jgi:hypothetical protein